MKSRVIFLSILVLMILNSIGFAQSKLTDKNLIVNFESAEPDDHEFASRVTNEFQEALINTNCFKVLERSKLPLLKVQMNDELQIMLSEKNSNSAVFKELKTQNVEYLALGRIEKDTDGGNYRISVRIVDFESTILAYQSIYSPYSIKTDYVKRLDFLSELASKLCPKSNKLPIEKEIGGIRFILQDVEFSSSTLVFNFTLINIEPSRTFALNGSTVAFDDRGRERFISTATLVDANVNFGGTGANYQEVQKRLVYDVPSKTTISFNDYPKDAKQVAELILYFRIIGVGARQHSLVFQNIDLR